MPELPGFRRSNTSYRDGTSHGCSGAFRLTSTQEAADHLQTYEDLPSTAAGPIVYLAQGRSSNASWPGELTGGRPWNFWKYVWICWAGWSQFSSRHPDDLRGSGPPSRGRSNTLRRPRHKAGIARAAVQRSSLRNKIGEPWAGWAALCYQRRSWPGLLTPAVGGHASTVKIPG